MKRTCLLILLFLIPGGCSPTQQAVVLKGGDSIKEAAGYLRIGVGLYDDSVKATISNMRGALYQAALAEFGKAASTGPADSPEQKATSLMKVIDNLLTEESRRNELRTKMLVNIDHIGRVANDMQKLAIYSATIDAQVKQWIQAQLTVNAAVIEATSQEAK